MNERDDEHHKSSFILAITSCTQCSQVAWEVAAVPRPTRQATSISAALLRAGLLILWPVIRSSLTDGPRVASVAHATPSHPQNTSGAHHHHGSSWSSSCYFCFYQLLLLLINHHNNPPIATSRQNQHRLRFPGPSLLLLSSHSRPPGTCLGSPRLGGGVSSLMMSGGLSSS